MYQKTINTVKDNSENGRKYRQIMHLIRVGNAVIEVRWCRPGLCVHLLIGHTRDSDLVSPLHLWKSDSTGHWRALPCDCGARVRLSCRPSMSRACLPKPTCTWCFFACMVALTSLPSASSPKNKTAMRWPAKVVNAHLQPHIVNWHIKCAPRRKSSKVPPQASSPTEHTPHILMAWGLRKASFSLTGAVQVQIYIYIYF